MPDLSDRATPRQTAKAYRDAMANRKWSQAFGYMTRKIQRQLIGGCYINAVYGASENPPAHSALAHLVEKHFINQANLQTKSEAELLKIFKLFLQWSDKYLSADQRIDFAGLYSRMEYSGFRISEDSASAIATCDGKKTDARFKRIDNRWYIA